VKTRLACLAACALISCAVTDHDATHDPVAAKIAGQCFALQQDAWIVKASQIPVRYSLFIPTRICTAADGSQSSGPYCYIKRVATVPKGSQLVVTDVIDKAMGEAGRCWQVLGVLKDDSLHRGKLDIPSCNFNSVDNPWTTAWSPELRKGNVLFDAARLKRCDATSAAP
jgi:hypothetical protein